MSKKEYMISWSFKEYGITLALDGSENADLNTEVLQDYEIPSAKEEYKFQLKGECPSCEKEQNPGPIFGVLRYVKSI